MYHSIRDSSQRAVSRDSARRVGSKQSSSAAAQNVKNINVYLDFGTLHFPLEPLLANLRMVIQIALLSSSHSWSTSSAHP